MKLTRTGLRQLIKEELARVNEIDTTSEVDRAAQEISAKWYGGQNLEGPGGRLDTLKFFLRRSQKFDPAEARRRTKMSTAMGDFVFNDFDESGIPGEQHAALAEKILEKMASESLSEGAAKRPDIEQFLGGGPLYLILGNEYEIRGDGVNTEFYVEASDESMAMEIAELFEDGLQPGSRARYVFDDGMPYNPLAGSGYTVRQEGTTVRWTHEGAPGLFQDTRS